jgi:phosphoenolpyruvate synthase/pyruvate phosphate dikinase
LNEDTPVLAETRTGTYDLNNGEKVTVECSVSRGNIWKGELEKTSRDLNLENTEKATEICLDVSNAENIFRYSQLPVDGARITDLKSMLGKEQNTWSESSKSEKKYVKTLKSGISRVCAAFHPKPVTAELSRAGVETFLDDDQERETPGQIELEIKAVERCISELGFENIEISLPPLATVKDARELRSKILEAEPDMENAGVYAIVESPEYVIQGEELLQEFQGIELKTENLIENMKGGLTEIESLDKDSLLQDIIGHTQPRSVAGELCVNIGKDTEYVKPSVRADADSIILNPEEVEKCLAQLTELEDEFEENDGTGETDAVGNKLEVDVETSIGGTAGEVYDRLAEKGEVQASALTDQLGDKMKERKIHQALGWLAKEGKISIHRSNNELTYSLK